MPEALNKGAVSLELYKGVPADPPETLPALPAPASAVQLRSLDDVLTLGQALAASGYFKGVRDAAQAVVKILAGAELGLPPVASMRGVYVVEGNTTLNASLVGSLIKKHPRYDYRVLRSDVDGCEIEFFEAGRSVGRASFTMEDARRAQLLGKDNWKKYPEDMCFARAMTRGARRYCSEVFNGPIYTPEELQVSGGPSSDYAEAEVIEPTRQAEPPEPPASSPAQFDRLLELLDSDVWTDAERAARQKNIRLMTEPQAEQYLANIEEKLQERLRLRQLDQEADWAADEPFPE